MDELISIIVPIYNVAPYLKKCITSICDQTYKNIEIILVDDGSTDGSAKICDDMAFYDKRIIVIHQPNGKITRARKTGIRISKGKYVGFVDGDDWIEKDMYQVLCSDAIREKATIVFSGMYRDNEKGVYESWDATKIGSGLFEGDRLLQLKSHIISGINGASVNKLFLRELVAEEIEKVDDELYGLQDDIFVAGCIARARRIYVEEKIFYHGYERSDSATHTRHEDYFLMMSRALPYYKDIMLYANASMRHDIELAYVQALMSGINEVFSGMFFPEYYFENQNQFEKNTNVVLYGAGNVGESFYQQITNKRMFNIVLWVDKNRRVSSKTEQPINAPTMIKGCEYEYVLIAVLNRDIAKSVAEELAGLGVPKDRIVWEEPRRVMELLGITPV